MCALAADSHSDALDTLQSLARVALHGCLDAQGRASRQFDSLARLARYANRSRFWMNEATLSIGGLVVVLWGRKELLAGSRAILADAGNVVWMPPGYYDSIINRPSDGRYEAVAIEFEPEVLARSRSWGSMQSLADETLRAPFACLADEALLQAVVHLVRGITSNATHGELLRHRLEEVLLALVVVASKRNADAPVVRSRAAVDLPTTLRQLVAANPCEDWTIARLATAAGLSAATLRRRLALVGVTAARLVREERLRLARELLQDPRNAIEEVSARCGYESTSHFARQFRAHYGVAPSAVRASAHRASA